MGDVQVTYTDIRETRTLKDQPELRKQVLRLREKGKLTRDDLKGFSTVVKGVSEPVRRSLLKEDSKLTAEEARIIDAELATPEEKERAIQMLEREKSPDRVRFLVQVIRIMEREREIPIELVSEFDVGDIVCPRCGMAFHLIHCEPGGSHKLEEKHD